MEQKGLKIAVGCSHVVWLPLVLAFALGCESDSDGVSDGGGDDTDLGNETDVERPVGWTEETHGNDTAPNYALLFDNTVVHRLDISLGAENAATVYTDLEALSEGFGTTGGVRIYPADPTWTTCQVSFNGLLWDQVGFRFKGNSSLAINYEIFKQQKHPFKLNFDRFSNEYPGIKGQRFYGFDKLAFANGFIDGSFVRDQITSDVLIESGVIVSKKTLVRVFMDMGEGPVYWGLYTMVEDPSNKATLAHQFGDGSGNLYKPETNNYGSDDAALTYFKESDYPPKTNELDHDYEGLIQFINYLNDPAERTDRVAWRLRLEALFDVETFLRFLATAQLLGLWDSYGFLAHNYYLYSNPSNGNRFTFITWDHNNALDSQTPMGDPLASNAHGLFYESFPDYHNINDKWPLIHWIMNDPVYNEQYMTVLKEICAGPFEESRMLARIDRYAQLIKPYVEGPEGEQPPYRAVAPGDQGFDNEIAVLKTFVSKRHQDLEAALSLL